MTSTYFIKRQMRVCSHADSHCPVLLSGKEKLHLPILYPAKADGIDQEMLACFEEVCLQIRDELKVLFSNLTGQILKMVKAENKFTLEDVEILSQKNCYTGFLNIEVLRLKHRLFEGGWSEVLQRELLIKDEAVGILLFDSCRDEVVMVRQFRVGVLDKQASPWMLELVAGMVKVGEGAEQVAIRESREESDCAPTDLVKILEYFNSPGTSNEKVTLFCGRVDARSVGGVHGLTQEHEDIEVTVLPFEEALAGVNSGLINNAMSIIALQWLELNKAELLEQWL